MRTPLIEPATRQTAVLLFAAILGLLHGGSSVAQRTMPIPEAEQRLRAVGYAVDTALYEGLDAAWLRRDLTRLVHAAEAVAAAHPERATATIGERRLLNNPATRPTTDSPELERYRELVLAGRVYPTRDVVFEEVGRSPVPIRLAPAARRLRELLATERPDASSLADLFATPVQRELPHAVALGFAPGAMSKDPGVPCAMSSLSQSLGPLNPRLATYVSSLDLGRVIVQLDDLDRVRESLAQDAESGARATGRIDVVAPRPGVYVYRRTERDGEAFVGLAFPLADANGAARPDAPRDRGPFAASITCPDGAAKGTPLVLRLPRPRPAGTVDRDVNRMKFGPERERRTRQEWFCVPADALEASPGAVALRPAPGAEPFREDWVVDRQIPGDDAGPLQRILVSAEASAAELVALFARLRGVPTTPVAADAAVLALVGPPAP